MKEPLIACITRWLPVLDEAELRAVEGFVLELVIESREKQIDLSARATPAVPHGMTAARVDAIPARDSAAGTAGPAEPVRCVDPETGSTSHEHLSPVAEVARPHPVADRSGYLTGEAAASGTSRPCGGLGIHHESDSHQAMGGGQPDLSPVERGLRELREYPVLARCSSCGSLNVEFAEFWHCLDCGRGSALQALAVTDDVAVIDDPDATWPRQCFDTSDADGDS